MFQKILVALDTSSLNRSVFEAALSLAKALNANVMLLHVVAKSYKCSTSDGKSLLIKDWKCCKVLQMKQLRRE